MFRNDLGMHIHNSSILLSYLFILILVLRLIYDGFEFLHIMWYIQEKDLENISTHN